MDLHGGGKPPSPAPRVRAHGESLGAHIFAMLGRLRKMFKGRPEQAATVLDLRGVVVASSIDDVYTVKRRLGEGQTALHAACASEQVEAARLLSDQTPCWELTVEDNYQMTPLHLATESGVEPLVALLLERLTQLSGTPGADVDAIKQLRRGTVQFLAARHGFAGVLDLLRDDGGGAEGGAAGEAAAAVRASPDCSVSEEV